MDCRTNLDQDTCHKRVALSVGDDEEEFTDEDFDDEDFDEDFDDEDFDDEEFDEEFDDEDEEL